MIDTKSYSKSRSLLAGLVAASVAMFLSVSCGNGNGSAETSMKEDPAGTYGKFLSETRNMDNLSTEELAISINRWQSLRDSVFFYATQDTSGNPHSDLYGKCNVVHDSLRTEFIRLAGSAPRSYQDVFVLKERTSPYCDDKELADAADSIRSFFVSLDSIPPLAIEGNGIRSAYRRLLARTLQDRIHNLTDLKTFIRDEDVMFRTFLAHLDDLAGEDMSDLTKDTERCCSLVFLATEKKEISYRDAMIYMAMRTNRRIIQNAVACLNDIREDKVKSRAQAFGYACMILQPYRTGGTARHADGDIHPDIMNETQTDMNMLRHFLNDFLSFVPLQLPQLLDVTTMEEPQFYGDYVLLTFPLRDTYELEEVMDMFEDDMELITLYHHIPMPTEQYGHSTCAYSNPAFGQMFKMNAKTDADGRVSCVFATIYDSLDLMYGDLCLDLKLHSKSGTLKYRRNKEDLLMDFI